MDPLAASASIALSLPAATRAQAGAAAIAYPEAHGVQTRRMNTRYELLAPETASFEIYYEVAATTAGATYFYK